MLSAVTCYLDGFMTWQTPVSFLAGVGAAQIAHRWVPKVTIERDEDDVQEA